MQICFGQEGIPRVLFLQEKYLQNELGGMWNTNHFDGGNVLYFCMKGGGLGAQVVVSV